MEIIRLNNQAASLASHGKQEDAVICLQHALAALKDTVEMVGTSNDVHICDPSSRCCQPQVVNVLADANINKCTLPTLEPSIESAFEFYDKIFLVSLDETQLRGCCSHQAERRQNLILATISKYIPTKMRLNVADDLPK